MAPVRPTHNTTTQRTNARAIARARDEEQRWRTTTISGGTTATAEIDHGATAIGSLVATELRAETDRAAAAGRPGRVTLNAAKANVVIVRRVAVRAGTAMHVATALRVVMGIALSGPRVIGTIGPPGSVTVATPAVRRAGTGLAVMCVRAAMGIVRTGVVLTVRLVTGIVPSAVVPTVPSVVVLIVRLVMGIVRTVVVPTVRLVMGIVRTAVVPTVRVVTAIAPLAVARTVPSAAAPTARAVTEERSVAASVTAPAMPVLASARLPATTGRTATPTARSRSARATTTRRSPRRSRRVTSTRRRAWS